MKHYNLPCHRSHIDDPVPFIKICYERQLQQKAVVFLNHAINALLFQLHLSGYPFCGPGMHLEKRLLLETIEASIERGVSRTRQNLLTEQRSRETTRSQ